MNTLADIARPGLAPLDWGVMAVYMLVLVAVGLYFRRFANQDLVHFFLAGRRLPGWANGVSNAATCMNADVAPAYCGMAVITGLYVCWFYFSRFGLGLMVAAVLLAPCWRRLGVLTSPEFYELRFSGTPAFTMRMITALRSAFVGVVIWIGAGLLGLAKIAEALLGWERWETFVAVLPIILLYVLLSGYMGVVVSDVLQSIIIVASSVVLMLVVWLDFGGPLGLHDALVAQFGPSAVKWHPPPGDEFLGVVGLIAWMFGTSVGYGGDLSTESQKLLSCRSPREAARMYIWTQVVLFLMLATLTLPALGAMARWPGLHDGTVNKELAFGLLLGHYLPPGLLGLALVALGASIMSTVDSHMNYAGQVVVHDVYRRLARPTASNAHYMRVGKLVMVAVLLLALLVATVFENVIDISIFMLGLFGAELAANWAQWWWWRFNGPARLAASLGGPLIYLFNAKVVFAFWIPVGDHAAYWIVLSSIAATAVLWVSVALLTRPDPRDVLVHFYAKARPPGWWGPIAATATPDQPQPAVVLPGLGVAALGLCAVAAAVLALSNAYVGRWPAAAASAGLSLAAALTFRTLLRRFLARWDADKPDRAASADPA